MKYFERLRAVHPIVHCITNYVTVNDCANLLLACGASPIMADEEEEVEEIAAISQGLVLNLGTLNTGTIRAMFKSGKKANALQRPILLDPVGAGASRLRTETALRILHELRPAVVRCNASEFKMLLHAGGGASRGVDVASADRITEKTLPSFVEPLRKFAEEHRCIIAVSGEIDLIASPEGRLCAIRNGVPEMELVTGSGCMLSSLCGAFAAACPERCFEAVCEAFSCMGIAGERAMQKTHRPCPTASFRAAMIDALSCGMPDMTQEVRCEMLA